MPRGPGRKLGAFARVISGLCDFWIVWFLNCVAFGLCGFSGLCGAGTLPAKSNHEQNCDYLLRSPPPYSANFLFNRRNNEVGCIPRIRAACVLLFPVAASTWSM